MPETETPASTPDSGDEKSSRRESTRRPVPDRPRPLRPSLERLEQIKEDKIEPEQKTPQKRKVGETALGNLGVEQPEKQSVPADAGESAPNAAIMKSVFDLARNTEVDLNVRIEAVETFIKNQEAKEDQGPPGETFEEYMARLDRITTGQEPAWSPELRYAKEVLENLKLLKRTASQNSAPTSDRAEVGGRPRQPRPVLRKAPLKPVSKPATKTVPLVPPKESKPQSPEPEPQQETEVIEYPNLDELAEQPFEEVARQLLQKSKDEDKEKAKRRLPKEEEPEEPQPVPQLAPMIGETGPEDAEESAAKNPTATQAEAKSSTFVDQLGLKDHELIRLLKLLSEAHLTQRGLSSHPELAFGELRQFLEALERGQFNLESARRIQRLALKSANGHQQGVDQFVGQENYQLAQAMGQILERWAPHEKKPSV